MNNPLETLLGKTFKIKTKSIGNQIESLLGSGVNKRAGSDFEIWEIKSKKSDAKSPMTLGGRAIENHSEILESIYNKMNNTILVWYTINDNKTFTIDKISFLFDLNKNDFMKNEHFYFETRKGQTTVRMSKKHFLNMYGKNIVEYY